MLLFLPFENTVYAYDLMTFKKHPQVSALNNRLFLPYSNLRMKIKKKKLRIQIRKIRISENQMNRENRNQNFNNIP